MAEAQSAPVKSAPIVLMSNTSRAAWNRPGPPERGS